VEGRGELAKAFFTIKNSIRLPWGVERGHSNYNEERGIKRRSRSRASLAFLIEEEGREGVRLGEASA